MRIEQKRMNETDFDCKCVLERDGGVSVSVFMYSTVCAYTLGCNLRVNPLQRLSDVGGDRLTRSNTGVALKVRCVLQNISIIVLKDCDKIIL